MAIVAYLTTMYLCAYANGRITPVEPHKKGIGTLGAFYFSDLFREQWISSEGDFPSDVPLLHVRARRNLPCVPPNGTQCSAAIPQTLSPGSTTM